MKAEEIKKIAEEYADSFGSDSDYRNDPCYGGHIAEAEDVLEFLTERFYLVEKGKAKKLCELAVNESSSIDYALIDGLTDWVESEFNEEYHNVIEGKDSDIRKEEEE